MKANGFCCIFLEIQGIVSKEEIPYSLLFFWKARIFFPKKKIIIASIASDVSFWKSRVLFSEKKITMVCTDACSNFLTLLKALGLPEKVILWKSKVLLLKSLSSSCKILGEVTDLRSSCLRQDSMEIKPRRRNRRKAFQVCWNRTKEQYSKTGFKWRCWFS